MESNKRRGRAVALKQNESKRKDRVWVMVSASYPVMYKLPTSDLRIYDEETDKVRAIRYCPEEPSIFVDSQNEETAKREPVWFSDGRIMVKRVDSNLQDFLDAHPDNVSNGGNVFKELNLEISASRDLEIEDLRFEAEYILREKCKTESGIQELIGIAKIYGIKTNRSFPEVKYDLLREAKARPQNFLDAFDNPTIRVKYLAIMAREAGIVDASNESLVRWSHNGKTICTVPIGEDHYKSLASFMLQDKGLGVREEIEKQLTDMGLI